MIHDTLTQTPARFLGQDLFQSVGRSCIDIPLAMLPFNQGDRPQDNDLNVPLVLTLRVRDSKVTPAPSKFQVESNGPPGSSLYDRLNEAVKNG